MIEPHYTIASINESRKEKKDAIRKALYPWLEMSLWSVDGGDEEDLKDALEVHAPFTFHPDWVPKKGEAGVWMTQMNAWKFAADLDRPLIVFEDDALLCDNFKEEFYRYTNELPRGWGTFSLFFPENQYGDFHNSYIWDQWGRQVHHAGWWPTGAPEHLIGSDLISKAYQGYGCVAIMYSPEGAAALYQAALDRNMYTPVDCFIFEQYRAGRFDAYSPMPGQTRLVDVDWNAPSTIQQTEKLTNLL